MENSPACPATPFRAHAFSSCTSPCTMPRAGRVWNSVAAMRSRSPGGGVNPVSDIPSGSVMRSAITLSNGSPVTRSISTPRVIRLRSE